MEEQFVADEGESEILEVKQENVSNQFECPDCSKVYRSIRGLELHLLMHAGQKPYKCEICGKAFLQSQHLKTHIMCHTGERPYECDICEKSFRHSSHLACHMLGHTGEKPYTCEICKKGFRQSHHLKRHTMSHMIEVEEGPFTCPICSETFFTPETIKGHAQLHKSEKPYECTVCKKCFPLRGNLKKHMFTHTGEKRFECHICGRKLSYKDCLLKHLKWHERKGDEKPKKTSYDCSYCSKTFTTPSNLKLHLLIHTDEKPHQCQLCAKSFRQRVHLETHMSTHTKEISVKLHQFKKGTASKPRGKTDSSRSSLSTHLCERKYQCQLCKKNFDRKFNFNRHLKLHGTEEYVLGPESDLPVLEGSIHFEEIKIDESVKKEIDLESEFNADDPLVVHGDRIE